MRVRCNFGKTLVVVLPCNLYKGPEHLDNFKNLVVKVAHLI